MIRTARGYCLCASVTGSMLVFCIRQNAPVFFMKISKNGIIARYLGPVVSNHSFYKTFPTKGSLWKSFMLNNLFHFYIILLKVSNVIMKKNPLFSFEESRQPGASNANVTKTILAKFCFPFWYIENVRRLNKNRAARPVTKMKWVNETNGSCRRRSIRTLFIFPTLSQLESVF